MGPNSVSTLEPKAAVRAAQYLRMSSEQQDQSIALQSEAIAVYAWRRGYDIVRTYRDEGKSGLTIAGRPGLKQLFADVMGGRADFAAILVYDVSRWGRFQDTDESAHYEFLCRQMGIQVHYCAEPFDNDGSGISSLLKSVKRVMAAEYSRDLSNRVRFGQERLVGRGFRVSGSVPYGYERAIVDRDGVSRGIRLGPHEAKHLKSDRVILVPGPAHEIAIVRRMFDLYVRQRHGFRQVAIRLNAEGVRTRQGRPWHTTAVSYIIQNVANIGTTVWGRDQSKAWKWMAPAPRTDLLEVPNAFQGIVEPGVFHLARALRAHRHLRICTPRTELLARLRQLIERHRPLASELLYEDPDIFYAHAYKHHFGSMRAAFAEAGYDDLPPRRGRIYLRRKSFRWRLVDTLIEGLNARGIAVGRDAATCQQLVVSNGCTVAIAMIRVSEERFARNVWDPARYGADAVLVARLWLWQDEPVDYYLAMAAPLAFANLPPPHVGVMPEIERYRLPGLEAFYDWAAGGKRKLIETGQ